MRNAILALLTLGPQYGLQLRHEIQNRAILGRAPNSGQIYQNLERLIRDQLITHRGQTDSGQILYALSKSGKDVAESWLRNVPEQKTSNPFEEMVFHVLIVRSLPGVNEQVLINGYMRLWEEILTQKSSTLRALSTQKLAKAAIQWLTEVDNYPSSKSALEARPLLGRPRKHSV